MELLASPFQSAFDQFADACRTDCILCSPYISAGPVKRLVESARRRGVLSGLSVHVLTDISAPNIVQGATDIRALIELTEAVTTVRVVYLPRVHAKVFVADETLAIVGSANFTDGGAFRNLEYGVCTRQPESVRRIRADMDDYFRLGTVVSTASLANLSVHAQQIRESLREEQQTMKNRLRPLSEALQARVEDELVRLRVSGRSLNATLSETILFLLRRKPMSADAMHSAIQEIHPDLCDDRADRVIDGKRYGKLWKHQVRTARANLSQQGRIAYNKASNVWVLIGADNDRSGGV